MSVFYDDFPVFEVEPLADLSTKIIDAFLNILGWRHAMQGKKAVGFSAAPIALGVQYHLQELWSGQLDCEQQAWACGTYPGFDKAAEN